MSAREMPILEWASIAISTISTRQRGGLSNYFCVAEIFFPDDGSGDPEQPAICRNLDHAAVAPPSTGKATPLINAASSEAR